MDPALLLQQLQQRKSHLQPSETIITSNEGKRYKEFRVGESTQLVELSEKHYGFVVDINPDAKVCAIPNVDKLFIGSQDAAVNIASLKRLGITHILNVATGIPNAFPELFVYQNVEVLDVDDTNITKEFPICFDFIELGIQNGGVLVHCNAGVSRSATVLIAYLMQKLKLSCSEAYTIVKQARSCVQPNKGFLRQLMTYESFLQTSDET